MSDAPAPDPSAGALVGPTADERTLAAVAHGLSFVEGGILGPLVVYLLKSKESPFVAFHALQSLAFGILMLVVVLATCGIGVVMVIPYIVFEAIATMKAHEGEWYRLPLVGDWAFSRHHP
jgi:uncharacterized membrane protein